MHAFAERFADAWARPTPARLVALLHDDIVLRQPHLPAIRGRAAASSAMSKLLRCLPELHGEVDRASGDANAVFIEWRMKPLRDTTTAIHAVDRFILRDGLAAERTVYFDQLAMRRSVLRHPRLWSGFVRYCLT
ncbi:nuclear transport factor 2 family protein [Sinimarinibacterium thermocellulolyticum]|uniref:Nuclear transport factor 2 family protein n=1 Tax=Sinimarinibacterium thermocellulolyticum TaxID=3170016 RepID=A0ABV2A9G8_9GAMM